MRHTVKTKGVIIRHYHVENGRLAYNAFIKSVKIQGQIISYCGVNANFQNVISEKRTRDLQEQKRKQILHAKSIWISSIDLELWPYALRNEN